MTRGARDAPLRPQISVVVPTYQRQEALRRLLMALCRQTLPPHSFEVVVAVDGSTDGTQALLEKLVVPYPLHWVIQSNAGRASARNAAIRASRGEIIVMLDDDMEPAPELLAAHFDFHASHDRHGVMGAIPVVLPPTATPLQRCFAARFEQHQRLMKQSGKFLLRSFCIGNFSIRRDHLNVAGLLDEGFVAYGNEDLELAVRLRSAGIAIEFCAEAVAQQHWSKDLATAARDATDKGRTAVLLAGKHPDAASELRLGTFDQAPGGFRMARNLALRIAAAWPQFPALVVATTRLAERVRMPGLERWYDLLLGYLYWVGAQEGRSRLRTAASTKEDG